MSHYSALNQLSLRARHVAQNGDAHVTSIIISCKWFCYGPTRRWARFTHRSSQDVQSEVGFYHSPFDIVKFLWLNAITLPPFTTYVVFKRFRLKGRPGLPWKPYLCLLVIRLQLLNLSISTKNCFAATYWQLFLSTRPNVMYKQRWRLYFNHHCDVYGICLAATVLHTFFWFQKEMGLYLSEPNKSISAFSNFLGQPFYVTSPRRFKVSKLVPTWLGYSSIPLFLKQIVECQEQLSRLLYQTGQKDPCRPALDWWSLCGGQAGGRHRPRHSGLTVLLAVYNPNLQ